MLTHKIENFSHRQSGLSYRLIISLRKNQFFLLTVAIMRNKIVENVCICNFVANLKIHMIEEDICTKYPK